ncbi:MAG: (Fe-S)-binding protein [Chloroflexota bacterium]
MNDPFEGVREDLQRCNKCGTCASVCPTYGALRRETTSARGRVSLIEAFLAGELAADDELHELLYTCLSCHSCVPACPNGVRVDKLVLAARAKLAEADGRSPWRQLIFRDLLPHPERLSAALWPARAYQALGLRTLVERVGLDRHLPGRLGIYGQMAPAVPVRSASRVLPTVSTALGPTKGRVGYFLGCAQNFVFPAAAKATVALLNLAGFDVVTPPKTVCCGMPALAYGERAVAREAARWNVNLFLSEGVEALVTDCASCGSFLKEYGELLADDPEWAAKAADLSSRTRDISEFLAANPPLTTTSEAVPFRVTYHDPCHLAHAQGVKRQPRDLLRSIPGLELVEMRTPGACCGSAGSYGLTHPDISTTILDKRIAEALETDAQLIATGCPACRIQLEFGVRRAGHEVMVRHVSELLAAAYGVQNSLL